MAFCHVCSRVYASGHQNLIAPESNPRFRRLKNENWSEW